MIHLSAKLEATNNREKFTREAPHDMSALAASVGAPRRASYPRRRTRARLVEPARASAETRAAGGSTEKKGKVFLIGAGPGGVDHVTVRALRLLRACDVVVHDDLGASDAALLDETPPSADRVHVGKRGGDARSWTQADIDNLLVSLCAEGKIVARLKGGCPSVFSRARSEMDALRRNGFSYELVPGVSSALAAPLRAGFPLTDVAVGKHFVVCSAHDPSAIDFAAFADVDTCVFLMAGRSVDAICEGLARGAGKDGSTRVAVVRDACGLNEAVWRGTIDSIQSAIPKSEKLSPCVVVVGGVCALGDGYDDMMNGDGEATLGRDVEPGSVAALSEDPESDLDLANLELAILDLDETAAGTVVESLRRMVQDRDARIKELEEELLVSKRAARMLRGRK